MIERVVIFANDCIVTVKDSSLKRCLVRIKCSRTYLGIRGHSLFYLHWTWASKMLWCSRIHFCNVKMTRYELKDEATVNPYWQILDNSFPIIFAKISIFWVKLKPISEKLVQLLIQEFSRKSIVGNRLVFLGNGWVFPEKRFQKYIG